jgi:hypothetical protein
MGGLCRRLENYGESRGECKDAVVAVIRQGTVTIRRIQFQSRTLKMAKGTMFRLRSAIIPGPLAFSQAARRRG